jgi:hypothetical protein
MSLTKLSIKGSDLFIPGQGEFGSDNPARDRKTANHFLLCTAHTHSKKNGPSFAWMLWQQFICMYENESKQSK